MESLQNQAFALSRSERHIKSVLTELWLEILLAESGGFRLVQKHASLQGFSAFDGCEQATELRIILTPGRKTRDLCLA
jgi:hypothetical protein